MFIEREIKLPSGSAAGIATREMRDPGSTTVYITYSSVQEFILLHINSVDTLELLPNHHLSSNSTSLNQCRPEERDARQIPRIRRDVFLLKNSVQPSRYIPELANIAGSNFREDDRWWGTASMPNPPCRASRRERERARPNTDFLVARGIPIAVTRCGYLKKTAIMPPVFNKRAAQIEPRRVAL